MGRAEYQQHQAEKAAPDLSKYAVDRVVNRPVLSFLDENAAMKSKV